jgi:hypothetical protein
MRSCAAPITTTGSAVKYVLLTRNKTRPRGFFLPGHGFVTVRQAEHCSGRLVFFAESSRLRLERSIKRSEERGRDEG